MNISREILRVSLLAVSIATFDGWTAAQEQSQPPQNSSPAHTVKLNLIVTDRSNHSIDYVQKDEVRVFEDKVAQTVSLFAKDIEPVDYVIAIDTSGSFKALLSPALEAVKLLINSNRESDETMLIRFISSDKIETVENFSSDKAKLVDDLKKLHIEDGQSAVVDAIYLAVKAAAYKNNSSHRRAVVLVSDGEDRASYYSTESLVKLLRANDVQVFVIGIVGQLNNSTGLVRRSPREAAEGLLTKVTLETGGRVFFPNNMNELTQATGEIIHDLHEQYVIGFQSNSASNDTFHKIEVRIAESPNGKKLTPIARTGYFVNPPEFDDKGKEKKKPKSP